MATSDDSDENARLKVLVAYEQNERPEALVAMVRALSHDVITRGDDDDDVSVVVAREHPDAALVSLGADGEQTLGLIEKIVDSATCPVILVLAKPDLEFVREASKRGVFAHVAGDDADTLQSAIEIALLRSGEYRQLQESFRRRATIERSKGILMERHSVDEEHAYALLRGYARASNRKLVDVATAIVDSYLLLPRYPESPPSAR